MDPVSRLRAELAQLVAFEQRDGVFDVSSERRLDGYRELRVRYDGIDEQVPALLLVPDGAGPFPAVLAHHQRDKAAIASSKSGRARSCRSPASPQYRAPRWSRR